MKEICIVIYTLSSKANKSHNVSRPYSLQQALVQMTASANLGCEAERMAARQIARETHSCAPRGVSRSKTSPRNEFGAAVGKQKSRKGAEQREGERSPWHHLSSPRAHSNTIAV